MWTTRYTAEPEERRIVSSGIIFIEGSTSAFSFKNPEENPINLKLPVLRFLRVRENHPLRVASSSPNFVGIYPLNETKRMPAEVFKDRTAWDITTFLLLPYAQTKKGAWQVHRLEGSFFASGSANGADASLLYFPGKLSIHTCDSTHRYGFIPAPQIQNQLFYWMTQSHRLSGFDDKHNEHSVGRLEVPFEQARQVTRSLVEKLERYYRLRILFEDQRREHQ